MNHPKGNGKIMNANVALQKSKIQIKRNAKQKEKIRQHQKKKKRMIKRYAPHQGGRGKKINARVKIQKH